MICSQTESPTQRLGAEAVKQLLTRGWMTHDGMWFMHCLQTLGVEEANRLNRAAIRSMAGIEVQRLSRALGIASVTTYADMRRFLEGAMDLAIGDFMRYRWRWHDDPRVTTELERCFAHDGIARMGAIEGYECGIYDRLSAWFDALGVAHSIEPRTDRCLMHSEGRCVKEIRFDLPPT